MVSNGAGGRAEKPHATGEVRERNSRWASVCASKATAARMPDCLEPTPLMGAVVAAENMRSTTLMPVVSTHCWTNGEDYNSSHEPPWYGTVRPVVWEGGITKAPLPDLGHHPGPLAIAAFFVCSRPRT